MNLMKLYDVPNGSKLKIDDTVFTFHHIDGMYSLSTVDEGQPEAGKYLHLAAVTPVKKSGDYYELDLP